MNNIYLSADEMAKIYLEDDNTETGGISFVNETLLDFCEELHLENKSVAEINKALKECGIKPIFVKEVRGDIGSYLVIGRNSYLMRKEYYNQGEHFKSYDNFNNHPTLPCYSAEYQDIEKYYTSKDLINLVGGNKQLAYDLLETLDWQHPETLWQEWRV